MDLHKWSLQDWTKTEQIAKMDIAGLDTDTQTRMGGH